MRCSSFAGYRMRTVDVMNLVTEDSIEHSMLHVLSQKQALADGVLDGQDDLKAMKLPSGRHALVERMSAMMAPPAAFGSRGADGAETARRVGRGVWRWSPAIRTARCKP